MHKQKVRNAVPLRTHRDVPVEERHTDGVKVMSKPVAPKTIQTYYSADLQYLVRLGDVRVCPARWEHKPVWKYSQQARTFVCRACRKESAA